MDPGLWKRLYYDQGWRINTTAFRSSEGSHERPTRQEGRDSRSLSARSGFEHEQPLHKKRVTSTLFGQQNRDDQMGEISQWREQHSVIEADTDMPDACSNDHHTSPTRRNKRGSQESRDEMILSPTQASSAHSDLNVMSPSIKPALTMRDMQGNEQLNWAGVYKQRRRLEENWNTGRFTNFQLPHPDFPHEAHRECVYTIQFVGKWLVSGSRDKTLRIWDLETRRLRSPPLTGHSQSVLCLQFDPGENEDIIISGSSDTSVIVWRFSTGQKLKEIPHAHRDPVLNLRFDHRFLVTCSKDKLIKVWNRKELSPLDADYPKIKKGSNAKMASYIIDLSTMMRSEIEEKLVKRQIKTLQPYSLLMALDGHGAAVNAIQICDDQIVSASGDRTIKVWSVVDGDLISTLAFHSKGIACVQFDSKRIVSGSSDSTVRIFDHAKQVQVAELRGHQELVRTVQADFGDVPYSDEAVAEQVQRAEAEYRRAVEAGEIVHETIGAVQSSRNQPLGEHDLSVLGATLPPGGGGSKWGRIVSGSYDETIIIWRKGADGNWVQGQTLKQADAVRAGAVADHRAYHEGQTSNGPFDSPTTGTHSHIASQGIQPSSVQIAHAAAGLRTAGGLMGQSLSALQQMVTPPGALQAFAQLTAHSQNMRENTAHATASSTAQTVLPHSSATQASLQATLHPPAISTDTVGPNAPNSQDQANVQPGALPHPIPGHHHHHHHHHPHHHHHGQQGQPQQRDSQPTSRVFKLQFDARRIICCSQDSRIVGWDFAAGDPDIIEASRFFVAS